MNYIDLGLPSGNLWCNCNYGTNWPTEFGKYFTFSEVEVFTNNKEELIPTKDDFQELIDYCKWEWALKGYKITGPNGNSIFLPAAGWRFGTLLNGAGEYGRYWSSTPSEGNSQYAYGLYFDSSYHYVDWICSYGERSVRRIKKVNKMKEVKIKVPEGYIIDEENSTFECIKFKKDNGIKIHKVSGGVSVTTPKYKFTILDKEDLYTNFDSAFKLTKLYYNSATIPTREQWMVIYENLHEINKYLENKIESYNYWTSEEQSPSICWHIYIGYGGFVTSYRNTANRVRPIINLI